MTKYIVLSFLIISTIVFGEEPERSGASTAKLEMGSYERLRKDMSEKGSGRKAEGWAYLISGVATLGISVPGFYLSDDIFAKVIYGVGQTLAVSAVNHGSTLLFVPNESEKFLKVLEKISDLNDEQKNQFAKYFLEEDRNQRKRGNTIYAASHSLLAALNFMNASITKNRDLRTALLFIGGFNTLIALKFIF